MDELGAVGGLNDCETEDEGSDYDAEAICAAANIFQRAIEKTVASKDSSVMGFFKLNIPNKIFEYSLSGDPQRLLDLRRRAELERGIIMKAVHSLPNFPTFIYGNKGTILTHEKTQHEHTILSNEMNFQQEMKYKRTIPKPKANDLETSKSENLFVEYYDVLIRKIIVMMGWREIRDAFYDPTFICPLRIRGLCVMHGVRLVLCHERNEEIYLMVENTHHLVSDESMERLIYVGDVTELQSLKYLTGEVDVEHFIQDVIFHYDIPKSVQIKRIEEFITMFKHASRTYNLIESTKPSFTDYRSLCYPWQDDIERDKPLPSWKWMSNVKCIDTPSCRPDAGWVLFIPKKKKKYVKKLMTMIMEIADVTGSCVHFPGHIITYNPSKFDEEVLKDGIYPNINNPHLKLVVFVMAQELEDYTEFLYTICLLDFGLHFVALPETYCCEALAFKCIEEMEKAPRSRMRPVPLDRTLILEVHYKEELMRMLARSPNAEVDYCEAFRLAETTREFLTALTYCLRRCICAYVREHGYRPKFILIYRYSIFDMPFQRLEVPRAKNCAGCDLSVIAITCGKSEERILRISTDSSINNLVDFKPRPGPNEVCWIVYNDSKMVNSQARNLTMNYSFNAHRLALAARRTR